MKSSLAMIFDVAVDMYTKQVTKTQKCTTTMFRPKSNTSAILVFYFFLLIIFLTIFLVGFFPNDQRNFSTRPHNSTKGHLRSEWIGIDSSVRGHNNAVKKLVFVVVDALRTDFVETEELKKHMPFVRSSIDSGQTCQMTVRTAAPTVTMPRIKAITSGTIPNYLDIVMNLGGSEFKQDTFIRQAYLHGMSLVFYGDDTWLKLFPHYFKRAGATHSFFAADFWEVDRNVTDYVTSELAQTDWDVMILHYLGLDHIGHMEGPNSRHIPKKLTEMDGVIHHIYTYLQEKFQKDYLFIVTGDHGMKDSGGHGGVTRPEVYVPLLSIGNPCQKLPGWPDAHNYVPEQKDIASTVSAALGLPIPEGNTGKLIPAFLHYYDISKITQLLEEMHYFLKERSNEAEDNEPKPSREIFPHREKNFTVSEINERYFEELSRLSSSKQGDEYNLTYMAIGCCGLWVLLVSAAFLARNIRPINALQVILFIGTVGHTLSLASSSFIEEEHQTWYYLWATFLLLCIRERWRRKLVVRSYIPDKNSCSLILLCVMHRLLRKLNHTGDKWAHLPDWHDFLRGHEFCLLAIYISGLVWMYRLFVEESKRSQAIKRMFFTALALILAYRFSAASFDLPAHFYPQSRGSAEVFTFFLIIMMFTYKSVLREGTELKWTWVLLAALTLRPHNLILIPTMIFASKQLHTAFSREANPFWNTLVHVWMGNVFYFYQGHSNSIANIDVAPAFIGVREYIPLYGGMLTAIHTYSAPVLAFLLSPAHYGAILMSRLLPLSLYCTLTYFQRHHLFVWSVFSPKLLLDAGMTLVLFFVVVFHKLKIVLLRYA